MNENIDHLMNSYDRGRVSRRQLVAHLFAIGAAGAGVTRLAGAQDAEPASSSTFSAKEIDHIALSVTDPARSSEWYQKHLGLTIQSQSRDSVFLNVGDDFLALFRTRGTPGLNHFSFGIPDYNQQRNAEKLRAAGLEPKLRGGRTYFDDPDGIEVQVSQAEDGS